MSAVYRQITLVRHGRSALELPENWITLAEFGGWIDRYNLSGIAPDSLPAESLTVLMADLPSVLCSDLPRAVQSAERLVPGVTARRSPLFREAGRPLSRRWPLRLPLMLWNRISVWLWRRGWITGNESIDQARSRARDAARELEQEAESLGHVACIGHGMFNDLVARMLVSSGWEGPEHVAGEHWGATTYRRRATEDLS